MGLRARTGAALVALAASTACGPGADTSPEGLWTGPLRHNGQESTFAIRLEPTAADSLAASVSMPAIGAFDLPVGTGVVEDGQLRIGGWTADLDLEAGTLTGQVPASLAPVYELPFTLRPATALPAPDLVADAAPAVSPVWTRDLGSPVWAGVAAPGERVLAATDGGTVAALDPADGSVAWSTELGGAIRATPTVDGGRVFVHADDGTVSRLDAATGGVAWSVSVGEPARRVPPGQAGSRYDHYGSGVLVANGRAVVGTYDGHVVALEPETGAEIWRVREESSVLGTPDSDGQAVYYATFDAAVVAVEGATGQELWRTPTSGSVVSGPRVDGDVVVVGNRAYDVLGLDAADGSVRWTHYYFFSWVESTATLRDGVAYLGSSDGQRLQALVAATGTPLWAAATGGSTWATPAVSADAVFVGTVGVADYMVAHQGGFLATDRATGRALWRFEVPRPADAGLWGFASSPAVADGRVFVGGLDGRVYAFAQSPP